MDDIDYYSYRPLVVPDRPLCVVGLPASHAGGTAKLVASFIGLQLFWLDRAVEHRAGRSIDAIALTEGDDQRRVHERALLPAVLKRPVPPVVVLSELTLGDPSLAELVAATATVLFIRRPIDEIIATIQGSRLKRPSAYARLSLGGPVDPVALRPHLERLERPMRRCEYVMDAEGLHPQHAAREVIDLLGWKLPAVSTSDPGH